MSVGELVLVTHRDPVLWHGGGPTFVRAWARAVQLAGIRPHIVSLADRDEVCDTPYGRIVRVRSPIRRSSSLTLAVNGPVLGRAVIRLLQDRPGRHVVHGFSGWPVLSQRAIRSLQQRGIELARVQTAWTTARHELAGKLNRPDLEPRVRRRAQRESLWNNLANERFERQASMSCDALVVHYDATAQILRRQFGDQLPLRKLPYLAESALSGDTGPAPRHPQGPSDGTALPAAGPGSRNYLGPSGGSPQPGNAGQGPMVLAISRHTARKGLDVLIRALAQLRDEGVAFRAVLASAGPLFEQHRRMVQDLRLSDRVELPGLVPDALLYLAAADIFVLPSLEEGSGSVSVLEALQAGLAVVSSDIDGMNEDITNESSGLLVRPGDVRDLAAALRRLIADRGLRERVAAGGRHVYEHRYSPEAVVPAIADFYRGLGLLPP